MVTSYTIRQAQARLPRLCRTGRKFVISTRRQPVMVVLPVQCYEAMLETLEVLSDPWAMQAIAHARTAQGTYRELDLAAEHLGL